jgi:imidazolonepropionase-like amidohydrolase
MRCSIGLFVTVLLGGLAACSPAEPPAPPPGAGALAIVGAQLVDGTGGPPIADSVLLVRDGRIEAVGARSSTPVPEGADVIDAAGHTIIPGLVDTHAHYHGELDRVERQYRKQLYFGVTTSRSIGADPPEKVALMLDARAGRVAAPRMFTAGLGFSYPDGFPAGSPVNRPATEDEARSMVDDLAEQGVQFVKMWVNNMPTPGMKITPEMRTAVVERAIRHDLIPVAHIVEHDDLVQLLDLGVRDFLHTVEDAEVSAELLDRLRETGAVFSPTLTNIHAGWYWLDHPDKLDDPEIRAAFEPEALARWSAPEERDQAAASPTLEVRKERLARSMAFVKMVSDAGVAVAVGTDSGAGNGSWNVPQGWGTHHELVLYVEAGLSPMQAIVAATATGATLLSKGDADFGTLEPGKVADLVLLDADPLVDISNTWAIDRVMQAGVWLDRASLLPMP